MNTKMLRIILIAIILFVQLYDLQLLFAHHPHRTPPHECKEDMLPLPRKKMMSDHYRGMRNTSHDDHHFGHEFYIKSGAAKFTRDCLNIDLVFSVPVSPLSIDISDMEINFEPVIHIAKIKYSQNGETIRICIQNENLPQEYRQETDSIDAEEQSDKSIVLKDSVLPLCTDSKGQVFFTIYIPKITSFNGIVLSDILIERLYPDTMCYYDF